MTGDEYRRTALRIRALGEHDKRWLLERLPAAAQEKVLAAVQALDGNTATPSLKNGADAHEGDAGVIYVAEIDRSTATEIIPILVPAPDWLAACVLGYRRWSWTEFFWQALPPARRSAILQIMKQGQAAVKLKTKEAIVEVLARSLMSKRRTTTNGHESFEKILKALEQGPEIAPRGWRFHWRSKWTR